ncbi:hypothetical protein ACFL6C_02915 [Myxococcota bacterium]
MEMLTRLSMAFLLSWLGVCLSVLPAAARAGYAYTELFSGAEETKMTIIWIPSGYSESQSEGFVAEVEENMLHLWESNWFADHKQLFNVVRLHSDDGDVSVSLWDAEGALKTDAEIQQLISSLPNGWDCTFHHSMYCKAFPSVILDATSTAGSARNGYIYIDRTAGAYEYAHEWGHEVLAYVLEDEYVFVPDHCMGSDRARNLDDINSNRKWRDYISTMPYEGANDCAAGVWRPTHDSIMRSPARSPHFDALGYEAMTRGMEKRYGIREHTPPTIDCDLNEDDVVSGAIQIGCVASDPSGIEMVEFFVARNGERHRSINIDWEPPYSAELDCSERPTGDYYLRAIAWDNHWNWSQDNPRFFIVTEAPGRPSPPTRLRVLSP